MIDNLPYQLYTAKQVRELDRIAIQHYNIAGIELMRRAGAAIFETINTRYPEHDLVIFCGVGNNAGDGYILAKLALDAGRNVHVITLVNTDRLSGDAKTALLEYTLAGGKTNDFESSFQVEHCLIVDAIFGTGLDREVTGNFAQAIEWINHASHPVLAVDIPSGLNADTGCPMGVAVNANTTVSLIGLKRGLFTGYAADYCGNILYASLQVPKQLFDQIKTDIRRLQPQKLPARKRSAHKGDFGHVLIVGGQQGYSGAVRMAGEAALRTGAGLVSIVTDPTHASLLNIGRPELMCHAVDCAEQMIPLLEKSSVIVIGPGLGQSTWAKDLLTQVMQSDKPLICDADALNLLALEPSQRSNWVLTPHPGEAARLLECSTQQISLNRFESIFKLQQNYQGVVLLKGAGTLLTNGQQTYISTVGNPGMATGGMGDVLAGVIAGLVAQKLNLFDAAKTGAYIHGKAADIIAEKKGERGLLATDLLPYIRTLIN